MQSKLELAMALWLAEHEEIPPPVTQHRFAPPRRWRFDFAWPDHLVAVEVDGVQPKRKAGHQTITGILNDCAKYEAAHLLGWRVYRVPGPWILKGNYPVYRPAVINTIRHLLDITA